MVAAKRETRPLKLKPFAGRMAFVNVIERRPLVHLLFKLAHLLELLASALLKNALGSLAVFFALEISTSFERIPAIWFRVRGSAPPCEGVAESPSQTIPESTFVET